MSIQTSTNQNDALITTLIKMLLQTVHSLATNHVTLNHRSQVTHFICRWLYNHMQIPLEAQTAAAKTAVVTHAHVYNHPLLRWL